MPISQQLLNRISSNDATLVELNLSEQITSRDDVALFLEALQTNHHLVKLTIHGKNQLTGRINPSLFVTPAHAEVQTQQLLIMSCRNVRTQERSRPLGQTFVDDADAIALAQHEPFEYLDLTGNGISNAAMPALAAHQNLKTLIIRRCNIGIQGRYQLNRSDSLEYIVADGNWYDYELHGQDWRPDEILDLLALAEVRIDRGLLVRAMAGEREAKIAILTYFNEHCESGYVIEQCIENAIHHRLYDFLESAWYDLMKVKTSQNRGRRDPQFLAAYQQEQARLLLERQVCRALDRRDRAVLEQLIPQLENGVNTFLHEQGAWLLTLAYNTKHAGIIRYLLERGAMVEMSEREKTPLYGAAEEGDFSLLKAFLQYGGNITGEFYFNSETAFSIAAFKLAHDCIFFFRDHLAKQPEYQAQMQALCDEWDVLWNDRNGLEEMPVLLDEPADQMAAIFAWLGAQGTEPADAQMQEPLWIRFGNEQERLAYDFARRCLEVFKNIEASIEDPKKQKISNYLRCYYLLHDKIAIMKERPLINREFYFRHMQPRLYYRLRPVGAPIERQLLSKQQATEQIRRLNHSLEQQKELDLDWSQFPSLWVAQYRCVHYYECYFTKNQILEHAYTSHLNRMAPAPAVYAMSSLHPGLAQMARESELIQHGDTLREIFSRFKETGAIEFQGRRYGSLGAAVQEQMSNDYAGFKRAIGHRSSVAHEILDDLQAQGYPSVAASDFPEHALRYGLGEKTIQGLSGHLCPNYQPNGAPQNPMLGKVFISLLSPLQMARERMCHVAGMHNRGEINLRKQVAPERETGAYGGLAQGYLFYEQVLAVPDFSKDYSEQIFSRRFGINQRQYQYYKKQFASKDPQRRRSAEAHILKHVKDFTKQHLLSIAQSEAQQRGGLLVYRHFDRRYGLEPEPMKGYSRPFSHERQLLAQVGGRRFAQSAQAAASAASASQSGNSHGLLSARRRARDAAPALSGEKKRPPQGRKDRQSEPTKKRKGLGSP